MRRPTMTVIGVTLALLLTACGSGVDDAPSIDPVPDDQTSTPDAPAPDDDPDDGSADDGADPDDATEDDMPTSPDGDAAGSDALLGAETMQVIDEVASEQGVATEDVQVRTVELVTWSDGSLGCPDPDMMYTQALVEGYRIIVEVDGTPVTYHGQDGQPPFRCDEPQEPVERR